MFQLNHKEEGLSKFATYESGMVRKIIRTRWNDLSCYQLNPQRPITNYYMTLSDNSELNMSSYTSKQRVKITNGLS